MTKSQAKKNRINAAPPASKSSRVESAELRREPVLPGIAGWLQAKLMRMPRLLRIVLMFVLAAGITGAIFPLVDLIYVEYFFTPDSVIVPSYISTGIGALFFLVGWYLIVGPAGENRVSAHPALVVYLLIGIAALCLDIVLIIQGFSMTDMISG